MDTLDAKIKALLSDPKKRAAWIIYQLGLKGQSIASLAREKGVNRNTLGKALRAPYPRMEAAIADALGLDAPVLFPERYDNDGLPNRRRGRKKKGAVMATDGNTNKRQIKQREAA